MALPFLLLIGENMSFRSKSYCLNINPIAWKRAGLNGKKFFDTQQKDKIAFGLFLAQQHGNDPLFNKPVHLDITFFMKIPQSKARLKTNKNGTPYHYHATVPDLDNLLKFIQDACKNVTLADDRWICSISAKKVYDNNPRTEFTITEIETANSDIDVVRSICEHCESED
jgi:Holliday junction resolvase RusA-like endonuclease